MTYDERSQREKTIFFVGALALIQAFSLPIILAYSAQHLSVTGFTVVSVLGSLAAICQWRMLWLARRTQAIGTKRAMTHHLLINLLELILVITAMYLFAMHLIRK